MELYTYGLQMDSHALKQQCCMQCIRQFKMNWSSLVEIWDTCFKLRRWKACRRYCMHTNVLHILNQQGLLVWSDTMNGQKEERVTYNTWHRFSFRLLAVSKMCVCVEEGQNTCPRCGYYISFNQRTFRLNRQWYQSDWYEMILWCNKLACDILTT